MLVFCSTVMLQLCSADRHASAGMLFVAVFWWTMCRTVLASLYCQPLAQRTCARWLAQFAEQVLRPTLGTSLVSCTRVPVAEAACQLTIYLPACAGMVPIVSGEIGEDLASYMVESEQTNSALGVGVSINRDASIRAAGGFLIQILPFASEETVRQLEANVQGVTSVTELLHQGKGPRDLAEQLLHGLGLADGGFSLQPR